MNTAVLGIDRKEERKEQKREERSNLSTTAGAWREAAVERWLVIEEKQCSDNRMLPAASARHERERSRRPEEAPSGNSTIRSWFGIETLTSVLRASLGPIGRQRFTVGDVVEEPGLATCSSCSSPTRVLTGGKDVGPMWDPAQAEGVEEKHVVVNWTNI
ncbi:hypothetical protein BHM03_00002370 [Ensete ventricosum]|nr:hypothetical protein BHM03_00002370 [Ensete ventricosum]